MTTKYLSSTSRNLDTTDYAWESVIHQFGRPLLDSELNLSQDVLRAQQRKPNPSGILQRPSKGEGQFIYEPPYDLNGLANPNFQEDTLIIERFQADVAGMLVDVKGTGIADATLNHVALGDPEQSGNRRMDFVFLEVWRKEVTPSMSAKARLRASSPLGGDTITFFDQNSGNTIVLTAGVDFQVSLSQAETARNISDTINAYDGVSGMTLANGIVLTAETKGTNYVFLTLTGGVVANFPDVVITSSSSGVIVIDQPAGGSDGEGKPNANQVYYNGNVDSHTDLWLADNIIDPNLNVSSSRRIQIQYRLRVAGNYIFSPSQTIYGYENPFVFAQGGATAPSPQNHSFTRSSEDYGLWVAGAGDEASATALECVDGYVYSIPIAFVFRREQSNGVDGFHPIDRFNTGVLSTHTGIVTNPFVTNVTQTTSDRPDGLYADEVAVEDVLDLRRCVSTSNVDFYSELKSQFHALLDGQNKTWASYSNDLAPTGDGTSGYSHTPLACDVFGDSTKTFNIGKFKRGFDHISRRFSNAPVIERFFVLVESTASGNQNPDGVSHTPHQDNANGFWYEGDQITIDLAQMDVRGLPFWDASPSSHPFGGDRVTDQLLSGASVTHLGAIWHNDGHYVNSIDQQTRLKSVRGLGTTSIALTLGKHPDTANGGVIGAGDYFLVGDGITGESTGSSRQIFVELIIEFPSGDHGLTGLAEGVGEDSSTWVERYHPAYPSGTVIPYGGSPEGGEVVTNPNSGNGLATPVVNFRDQTREVTLEYVYSLTAFDIVSYDQDKVYLPFRFAYDNATTTIEDTSSGVASPLTIDTFNSKGAHAEPTLVWSNGWVSGQRLLTVTANPLVPYTGSEGTGHVVYVFYKRSAPQTCGADFPLSNGNISTNTGGAVPIELDLEPLAIGDHMMVDVNSPLSFPFLNGTSHLGNSLLPQAGGYDEYELLNTSNVYLDDLTINSGFVELPTFVTMAHNVTIKLGHDNQIFPLPPTKDAMGRVVYRSMRDYFPALYAKNLGMKSKWYKTAVPCLMKILSDDHDLYRKGEVVLVVFTNILNWDRVSKVEKLDTVNSDNVVACVYRTRDQLLLGD